MQAMGALPQTSDRPASEPSGRPDASSNCAEGTGGRRAVSTSAIAASPFANDAGGLARRGSPAHGAGVPVQALAAAMPNSHSAPPLEDGGNAAPPAADVSASRMDPADSVAERMPDQQGAEPAAAHAAERRASGAAGNVSVSAAAATDRNGGGMAKEGSGDSSGGRSPSVSGLLRALPDRRPPPRLDMPQHGGGVPGGSPRSSVTSPRDLGVFASYPIPEEEAEGEHGPAAAVQLAVREHAASAQGGKPHSSGKENAGGQKRSGEAAAVLDCDGSGAVQQQQLEGGGGLRPSAAH